MKIYILSWFLSIYFFYSHNTNAGVDAELLKNMLHITEFIQTELGRMTHLLSNYSIDGDFFTDSYGSKIEDAFSSGLPLHPRGEKTAYDQNYRDLLKGIFDRPDHGRDIISFSCDSDKISVSLKPDKIIDNLKTYLQLICTFSCEDEEENTNKNRHAEAHNARMTILKQHMGQQKKGSKGEGFLKAEKMIGNDLLKKYRDFEKKSDELEDKFKVEMNLAIEKEIQDHLDKNESYSYFDPSKHSFPLKKASPLKNNPLSIILGALLTRFKMKDGNVNLSLKEIEAHDKFDLICQEKTSTEDIMRLLDLMENKKNMGSLRSLFDCCNTDGHLSQITVRKLASEITRDPQEDKENPLPKLPIDTSKLPAKTPNRTTPPSVHQQQSHCGFSNLSGRTEKKEVFASYVGYASTTDIEQINKRSINKAIEAVATLNKIKIGFINEHQTIEKAENNCQKGLETLEKMIKDNFGLEKGLNELRKQEPYSDLFLADTE